MKRQTIYCLITLAGLALSPLAYSSPAPRRNTMIPSTARQQGESVKSNDAPQPGVGITKTGPGRLVLNYVVKREDGETKVEVLVERGAVKKVTAADARGKRTLKSVKSGAQRVQACDASGQTRESLKLDDGQVIDIEACKSGLVALLLPAVQKIREPAARSQTGNGSNNNRASGGATCTEDKPCCFADEMSGMSLCWHP